MKAIVRIILLITTTIILFFCDNGNHDQDGSSSINNNKVVYVHGFAGITSSTSNRIAATRTTKTTTTTIKATTKTSATEEVNGNKAKVNNKNGRSSRPVVGPKPIDYDSGWPHLFPAKEHCSRCGLCETSYVRYVKDSCAFLNEGMKRIDTVEKTVHGRRRDLDNMGWSTENKEEEAEAMTLSSATTNIQKALSSAFSPSPDTTITGSSEKKNIMIAEEARFGVMHEPMQLVKGRQIENAQWTGTVTAIAVSMLESNMVDAVVCISNKSNDDDGDDASSSWVKSPEPILAKTVEDVLKGRGVKPALAPSLKILDDIRDDPSIRKLLFCGVGCAVQAFRAVEKELNLEQVYVLGTNCADNSPTPKAAEAFIRDGVKVDTGSSGGSSNEEVLGYEFMQDFRVHVKKSNNEYIKKPYFSLPGTIAEASIAKSCLACFDYTNALADVVIGYMAAPLVDGEQMNESLNTITIRNARGKQMVNTAMEAKRVEMFGVATGTGKYEKFAITTVVADSIVMKLAGDEDKIPTEGIPVWIGEIMAFAFRNIGPKGVNFAKYSIDYHILRNYLHVLYEFGEDYTTSSIPEYSQNIINYYRENDETFESLRTKVFKLSQKYNPKIKTIKIPEN